jgi:hypothetical protein
MINLEASDLKGSLVSKEEAARVPELRDYATDIDKEKEEMTSKLVDKVQKLFKDPMKLKKMSYESAKTRYTTSKQLARYITNVCKQLSKKEEFNDQAISEFRNANSKLMEIAGYNDKLIKGLTEIAKKEGMRKALTKKSQNSVIRSIFPTADDYIRFREQGAKVIDDYLTNVQKAMAMDGETGAAIGVAFGAAQDAIGHFKEFTDSCLIEQTKKEVSKIYRQK